MIKLVKSMLGAIPVHQLLVYTPPKKCLKQIEKIQRGFLWAARADANGGHCHMNWRRGCRPISHGGLGVDDLERQGLALRWRWLWLSSTDATRAWSGLDLQFFVHERDLFRASTTMIIGDGTKALFWDYSWIEGPSVHEIVPQLYACIPKRRRKIRTVSGGLHGNRWACDIHGVLGIHEIGQLQLWQLVHEAHLREEPDRLQLRWTADVTYKAKSCYLSTFHGSMTCFSWKLIWKCGRRSR
jgi:hypothetical protein